jgi:hypothetical protein
MLLMSPLLLPLRKTLLMPMPVLLPPLMPLPLPLLEMGVVVGVVEMEVDPAMLAREVMVLLPAVPILVTQVGLEPRFSMGVGL